MNARNAWVEPDGIRVADEVDLMPAIRQLEPKLGGDDAAASIGRIASDPDVHPAKVA
jgi:hypothetical protein